MASRLKTSRPVASRRLASHGLTSRPVHALVALACVGSLAACGVDGGSSNDATTKGSAASSGSGASSGASGDKTVTLVTHDSWAPEKNVMAAFTKKTGYTVKVVKSGDAGSLANKLVLSKNNPLGDVVFGIDNTFASRVTKNGVIAEYTPKDAPASASQFALPEGQGKGQLAPIDTAAVCVNVDDAWFTKNKKTKPQTLDDLTKPEYKGLMVAPGAASSSPGMAFFLATVGKYGQDGWKGYWSKLMANDLKLTSGWSDAYEVDFTAGGGKGTRPIVVSYDSSPAFTVDKAGKTTTSALLDTCFRSTEYAGVLTGAKNPDGAKALVDFMNTPEFQKTLPDSMYVFPVDTSVALPEAWAKNAKRPTSTIEVSPADIDRHRSDWLTGWKDVTSK